MFFSSLLLKLFEGQQDETFISNSQGIPKMKKRLWILLIFGLFIIAASAVLLVVNPLKKNINPVILIGLDGADWNIIDPLLKKGKLPHLKNLIQEGTSGILETIRPTKSPVIWTSIATGKTMIKHGILDMTFVTKNNIEVPYTAGERKTKAIWNILSENDLTVGITNWFCTFPPEDVNGYLVSNRFRMSVFKYLLNVDVTFPSELKKDLFPHVIGLKDKKYGKSLKTEGLEDYFTLSKNRKIEIPESRATQVKRFRIYFLQDKSIENISLHLFEKRPVDFFSPYFRLIDTTSHFSSLFISEELRERWIEEFKQNGRYSPETELLLYEEMAGIIEPVYTYLDNVVGRIMAKAEENTTFILVSDHGFVFTESGYNHYNTDKLAHGIVILKGPDIKKDHRLQKAHIFDIAPTILYLFGLPAGKDMDGRVLLDAFQDRYAKRNKAKMISTYDSKDWALHKKERSRELDEEELEDLRTLGYIK